MLVTVATVIAAARVLIVPVGDDPAAVSASSAAAAAVVSVGFEVVDDVDAREALALANDAGCSRGEVRCLARVATIAEARAAVAIVDVASADGGEIRAVVVSAAGERRRVQVRTAQLEAGLVRALVPPTTATLRVSSSTPGATAQIDGGTAVVVDAHDVAVAAGEHRVRVIAPGFDDQHVVVVIDAGESVLVPVVLAPSVVPPPTIVTVVDDRPLWRTTGVVTAGAVAVIGGVVGSVFVARAGDDIARADAATFQSDRVDAANAANLSIAGAAVAFGVGAAAVVAGVLWWIEWT